MKFKKEFASSKVTYLTKGLGQRTFKIELPTTKVLPSAGKGRTEYIWWSTEDGQAIPVDIIQHLIPTHEILLEKRCSR